MSRRQPCRGKRSMTIFHRSNKDYKKAGFRDVVVRAVPVQRYFPSMAEAMSAMKDSFPRLQTVLNKLSDADRALVWNEIEQQLSRFVGPTGFEAPGEWLIGVGTK
jgi:hypothetical protein